MKKIDGESFVLTVCEREDYSLVLTVENGGKHEEMHIFGVLVKFAFSEQRYYVLAHTKDMALSQANFGNDWGEDASVIVERLPMRIRGWGKTEF
jgi:hypothetical protein